MQNYQLRDKSKGSKLLEGSTMGENTVLLGRARLKESHLYDLAVVMDNAQLKRSQVGYQGKVFGNAQVIQSYVGGNAVVSGNAKILGSALLNMATVTDNGFAHDSLLSDRVIVQENAKVYDCHISGNVVIAGSAVVRCMELQGDIYLNEGLWSNDYKPCYCPPNSHVPWGITESVLDRWTIGCTTFSYKFWMDKSEFAGKKMGLTPDQVQHYRKLLTWFRQSVKMYRQGKYIEQLLQKENAIKN